MNTITLTLAIDLALRVPSALTLSGLGTLDYVAGSMQTLVATPLAPNASVQAISPKPETRKQAPETQNLNPQTLDPKLSTLNPKP